MKIIGITGTIGAGKGTVVDYLVQKEGYSHHSARTLLTKEVAKRGLPVNRDSMRLVGDELRKTRSLGYIMEELLKEAMAGESNAIIESIRTVAEVEYMRKTCPSFILLSVDADPRIRYERIYARKSETDNVTFEKFQAQEKAESLSGSAWEMNLPECARIADFHLVNDGSLEELETEIKKVLEKIGR